MSFVLFLLETMELHNETKEIDSDKEDLRFYIKRALQNKISWKSLESIFNDMTSTIKTSKCIIAALLDELQMMQLELYKCREKCIKLQNEDFEKSSKELQNEKNSTLDFQELSNRLGKGITNQFYEYVGSHEELQIDKVNDEENEKYSRSNEQTEKNNAQRSNISSETGSDPELVDDEIEFLKVVKERVDEEMYSDFNETTKCAKNVKNLTEIHEIYSGNEETNNFVNEIDNRWYTFVTNQKACDTEIEAPVEKEEMYSDKPDENKSFESATCSKKFFQKKSWIHQKNIHTGEKPYECKTCMKRFNQKCNLKTHERIHTGEVPYECKTCKKRFKQKGTLKKHQMIHTGELKYVCKICNRRFSLNHHLVRHERIHTGEKPYKCKTCQKNFFDNGSCKRHEKTHTDGTEKPIKCQQCKTGFKKLAYLKIHLKKCFKNC